MRIGVLSLQGGVVEHLQHLSALNAEGVEVKKLEDLEGIDGLILPGGESTAIAKILNSRGMLEPLKRKIEAGLPVWGTCAGMILLAKNLENDDRRHLAVMDIKVMRNAYGTQKDSFETKVVIPKVAEKSIPLVFIRAPYITEVGEEVEVLCELDSHIVAARQRNILVTSFHPELTPNLEFHRYFLKIANL